MILSYQFPYKRIIKTSTVKFRNLHVAFHAYAVARALSVSDCIFFIFIHFLFFLYSFYN